MELIFRLMDEAAAVLDDEPLAFDLTGGEPFVDFDRLEQVIAYGSRLGGPVSCVTNAFWAHDDSVTRDKLTRLHDAGLTSITVSVSQFHHRFVPLHRVRRALAIATEVGIRTGVKAAIVHSDTQSDGPLQIWKQALRAERISLFPVLPYLRDGESLPEAEYIRDIGLPYQRCPSRGPCVDFDGIARSCCSLVTTGPFLVIGDARAEPMQDIHDRFLRAGKQRILRESGPIEFARRAIAAGQGDRLRKAYAGPCDLCLHIQEDPTLREIAEEASRTVALDPDNSNNLKRGIES
jgi:hypothetical protein